MFAGTKLAHFNFVGDSVLGENVNLEAGSIICNYRNERAAKEVLVRVEASLHRTGCEKFGALVGDGSRIGANGVVLSSLTKKSLPLQHVANPSIERHRYSYGRTR